MKKKYIFISILFLLCLISLTGCGGGNGDGNNPPHTPSWQQLGANFGTTVTALSKICIIGNNAYLASEEGWVHGYCFNGVNWGLLSSGLPANSTLYPSLLVSQGKLYLSFEDVNSSSKATVMTHNTTSGNWEPYPNSGGIGISGYQIFTSSLAATSDTLYIGMREKMGLPDYRATVMKSQNGGAWSAIGSAGFSGENINTDLCLAVFNNTPYFLVSVAGTSIPKVYTYSSTWTQLGAGAITTNWTQSLNIAVDSGGTPYVAYFDGATSKVVVKKYNSSGGGSWDLVPVGSTFVSDVAVTNLTKSVAFFMDGDTPYVAYQDNASKNIIVKKYLSGSWQIIGSGFPLGGSLKYISICVTKGVPYVACINGDNTITAIRYE